MANITKNSKFAFYLNQALIRITDMSDKLQELTDKLYLQGLSKGKEEGEQILAKAREEAEALLSKAKQEAADIVGNAGKEAEDLKQKVASDIRMASEQCLLATRKDIENLITGSISEVKPLSDPDFLKEIVKTVAGKFNSSEAEELSVLLPASLQDKLEPWVAGELAGMLGKGIKAGFSKKISGGFSIGPKDGSYYISMTDSTFRELISEYLSPVTRKLLFGE